MSLSPLGLILLALVLSLYFGVTILCPYTSTLWLISVTPYSQKKLIVGVTGGIGSGKSTVTDILAEQGIDIIDADVVARLVVQPGTQALQEIGKHFGEDLIRADGTLDRTTLRAKIFADASERQWLESLLHPKIRQEIQAQLAQSRSPYCVLSSPLLFESGQHTLVDKILLVDTTEDLQLSRTKQRDNTSSEAVSAIMATQWSRAKRQEHADIIILNDGSLDALRTAVLNAHQTLLAQSQSRALPPQ